MKTIIKYTAFIFLTSCASLHQAPNNKEYLVREFNDNGELVSETVVNSYRMKFEKLIYTVNGVEVYAGENFEIRQLNK